MLHRSAGSKPITGNIPSYHQCMNQTLVLPVPLAAPCPSLWYNIRRAAICSLLPSPAHLAVVGMDDAGVPIWVTSGARYTDLLSVTFAILSGLAVGSLCGMAILKSAQIWRYHSYGAPCKTLSSSSMAPCVGSPVSCPALVQAATLQPGACNAPKPTMRFPLQWQPAYTAQRSRYHMHAGQQSP